MPVQIELLTHTEIYDAIHKKGYTTVLVYNGGTEQRGPHAVLGGHTFIAYGIAERLAQKLGNALVAPVLLRPAGRCQPGTHRSRAALQQRESVHGEDRTDARSARPHHHVEPAPPGGRVGVRCR